MSVLRTLAAEIDRLVLAVNQAGAPVSRDEVDLLAAQIGVSSPALFKHFSEWLLTIGIAEDTAVARLPYLPDGAVAERIAEWRSVEVVREEDGRIHAEPHLRPLLEAILDARADAAEGFWDGHDHLTDATFAIASVVGRLDPRLTVAYDHASIPLPSHAGLAFHQMLTSLRYARAAAHVEAWRSAGLAREDVLALTSLWKGEPVTRGDTARLEASGYVSEGAITDEGRALRSRIEDDTDVRNAPVFESADVVALRELLRSLPTA